MNEAKLCRQLILHEGLRLKPYTDTVGKLTIGVGRNLTDNGITRDEAMHLLHNDIIKHWDELKKALPFVTSTSEVRQRVFLDLAFNMGVPRLLNFKQTLAAAKRGDWWMVGQGLRNSLWADQVGDGPGSKRDRADRLIEMVVTDQDAPDIP